MCVHVYTLTHIVRDNSVAPELRTECVTSVVMLINRKEIQSFLKCHQLWPQLDKFKGKIQTKPSIRALSSLLSDANLDMRDAVMNTT